jgi:predicted GNAT superfamily acetyltransferase
MVPETSASQIAIRACKTVEEWTECVRLQSRIWGYSEADLLPWDVFAVAAATGGQVLGAFWENHLIGFSLSFVGFEGRVTYLHSNMTAVLPEYRNKGVGKMLKLAQRADGIARGFSRMEWTFDPLQIRNAYFNIVRLGAVVRKYLPNLYGMTSSPLHQGRPTDRLLAEWWWESSRVLGILRGEPSPVRGETRSVPVSPGANELGTQAQLREQFERLFHDGWAVTSFERTGDGGAYILTRWSAVENA